MEAQMSHIEKEVSETLNEINDHEYYVYALCEKRGDSLIPFYIGKGEGGRVWAHEKGEEKERNYLIEHFTGEELEYEKAQLSEKYKKIESLGKDKIEKIIIKSGMTSMEAFMAEGALINLFQRDGLSFSSSNCALTNIQKGHSSEGEKKQGIISKARTIEEFYQECAKPPLIINNLKAKVIFRSINKAYPQCVELCKNNKEELNKAILASVKGFWREANPSRMDYLFAVYQGRVKGVYRIKSKNGKKIAGIWNIENDDYPYYPGLEIREKDFNLCKKLKEHCVKNKIDINYYKKNLFSQLPIELHNDFQDFFFDKNEKNPDYDNKLKNWLQRKYYFAEEITEDDENYQEFTEYIGCKVVQINGTSFEGVFKAKTSFVYSDHYSDLKDKE